MTTRWGIQDVSEPFNTPDKFYLGSSEADRVYWGNTRVYPFVSSSTPSRVARNQILIMSDGFGASHSIYRRGLFYGGSTRGSFGSVVRPSGYTSSTRLLIGLIEITSQITRNQDNLGYEQVTVFLRNAPIFNNPIIAMRSLDSGWAFSPTTLNIRRNTVALHAFDNDRTNRWRVYDTSRMDLVVGLMPLNERILVTLTTPNQQPYNLWT